MELVLTYTTTDNKKLALKKSEVKSHKFKNNVGYVTLKDTYILAEMFEYQHTLKSVVIPNGVTSIGNYAFYSCYSLMSIEIPNTVTEIGSLAFYCCTALTNIEIPNNSVTEIGNFAFYNCTSLTNINIPSGVTSIGQYAFKGCTALNKITIPNSVTSIGWECFRNCINLTSIEIPSSVTRIDYEAFYHCTSLTTINIPSGVTSIGQNVFSYCKSLPCYKIDRDKRPILVYKGFNKDMSCRGFKYEIGKAYHEEKAKLCVRGFHACLNPLDVLTYYPNECGSRYALVELSGDIDFNSMDVEDSKVAATDIKIVKELSYEELIKEFNRLNNN